jgi:hypothetical protein
MNGAMISPSFLRRWANALPECPLTELTTIEAMSLVTADGQRPYNNRTTFGQRAYILSAALMEP